MHFNYKALDGNSKRVSGELEAENVKAAGKMLRLRSLLPISIEAAERGSSVHHFSAQNVFGRVKLIEKINFIKNLGVMMKAGFPVSRALKVLADQTGNIALRTVISDIAAQVEAGQTLADAMAKHPRIFSSMFASVVKVGEISGNLESALHGLAVQLERDNKLLRKTRGAMIYPSIVLGTMVLVTIVMFTFVLPKLVELFLEFEVDLPLITRIVVGMVEFMKHYGIYVLFVFIASVVSGFLCFRNKQVKKIVSRLVLKIPVLGKISRNTNLARFSRILASLLASGMPILESIRVTGESLRNDEYKKAARDAEKTIRVGDNLSVALQGNPNLFPPLTVSMISIGEESGTLETTLEELANFYEDEVDQSVSNLSSMLEPLLMILVGVGVGILAMSLIMPIYRITQTI